MPSKAYIRSSAGGADIVLECAGITALTEQGFHMLRAGGTLVQIGVPALDQTLPVSSALLTLSGKKIKAGKIRRQYTHKTDIPMLLDFYHQGRLDLDRMVSNTYGIDQIHQAFY